MDLEFFDDPAAFLAAAEEVLAADPVVSTVVTTVAARAAVSAEPARPEDWYVVARDRGAVVGAGMRTARGVRRPAYLLPMPDEAAELVARTLHARGEELAGVNGALTPVRACAEETSRLTGAAVVEDLHARLFEATEVVPARPTSGTLRMAVPDDLDLAAEWFGRFHDEADAQAGRTSTPAQTLDRDDVADRIATGCVWLWEDPVGTPVSLTGVNLPSFGVSRIGPVFTPPEHRCRGYASASVAQAAQAVLDAGDRICLFTDQANPTSNRVYQALGFRPLVDTLAVLIG